MLETTIDYYTVDVTVKLFLLKAKLESGAATFEEVILTELHDRLIFYMSESGNDMEAVQALFQKLCPYQFPIQKTSKTG